jgi:hypothetical protein
MDYIEIADRNQNYRIFPDGTVKSEKKRADGTPFQWTTIKQERTLKRVRKLAAATKAKRSYDDIRSIWRSTHPDFRGEIDGTKCVLVLRAGSGTCSVAIEDLTDSEFDDKLRYAKGREARGEKPYR